MFEGLLFTFFPWCYNCIIKLSSQVRCRYCWWIVVACGSRDGKICCTGCSLGTQRQVITPPRLLRLIHKPYKDVVSEGRRKNFNVHSNIVTGRRQSENTWAAYLHFLQHYRGRQVSSEWNTVFPKIISRKIFPQQKRCNDSCAQDLRSRSLKLCET